MPRSGASADRRRLKAGMGLTAAYADYAEKGSQAGYAR